MPYQIRHKATGEIVKCRSGKSVWSQKGHAKAAYKTSGIYFRNAEGGLQLWGGWNGDKFDDQTLFELVEMQEAKPAQQRWKFAKDDDGHLYLIPAELAERFYECLYDIDDDAITFNNEFEQYYTGTGTSSFTFTDPKEE